MFGTIEALEQLVPAKMTSSSSPSRTQVIGLMERHSSLLEVRIRAWGIAVPETATPAYHFLERIVLLRTAADVYRRRAIENGEPQSPMADTYDRQADRLEENMQTAPQSLVEH